LLRNPTSPHRGEVKQDRAKPIQPKLISL